MKLQTMTQYQEMVTRLAKPGADIIASLTPVKVHLWHMASCIMGEVAELITGLDGVDDENVLEELGDIEFYLEGFRQGAGITASDLIGEPTVGDNPRLLVQVSADLFDVTKKHVIYGQPFDGVKVIQHLMNINHLLYKVRWSYRWSHQDVLDANYEKLSKRYPQGGYTDQAATVRADKDEVQIHNICPLCNGTGFEEIDYGHYPCGNGCKPHLLEMPGDKVFVPTPPEFDSQQGLIDLIDSRIQLAVVGQETLSDYDHPDSWKAYGVVLEVLNGVSPDSATDPLGYFKWECEARAKMKIMRADAVIAARKGGQS